MATTDQPRPGHETAPSAASPNQSAIRAPRSAISRVLTYRTLWIIATIVFVADQVTKEMIAARLPFGSYGPNARIEVIPGFFNLVHVGNTGAAWSMFSGKSLGLAFVALGALVAIFIWRRSLGLHYRSVQPSFGLLCGGILGNLVDRVRHGHVIDFLDLHFGGYIYPTFNVADSAICVGVFWYVLWSLRQPAEPAAGGK
jgi:signal peptidase II